MKRILAFVLAITTVLCLFAACSNDPAATSGTVGTTTGEPAPTTTVPATTAPADPWAGYDCLTIAQAIEICRQTGTTQTAEKYYIRGTVTEIVNGVYGNITVSDGTDSIFIYGTWSADGTVRYDAMDTPPAVGDEVLLWGALMNYKDSKPEMVDAWVVDMKTEEIEFDQTDYAAMTIAQARQAADDAKIILTGVVARITYADGMIPSGFILVDGTDSLYIYGRDTAARVSEGNTVTIAGSKTHWILDDEQGNAAKFGYPGCNQLENVYLLENDGGMSDFDKTWVTEATVQDMLDTDFSEDVTGRIFKVTAYIRRTESGGVVNYYINDLDGITGSYCYSQTGCAEFDKWLREFDGKICTVYLTALNAKSKSSGCNWRFLPVSVSDDGYAPDDAAKESVALRLYAAPQFLDSYTGDPAQEMITSVSNDLLGFSGLELTYASDNTDVVYFEKVDGKVIFHCGAAGTANVTISGPASYVVVTITVKEQIAVDYVDVNAAINTSVGETVSVKGIVGPSVVAPQKTGFYLIDETGLIVVLTDADTMATLQIGQEIVIQGKRDCLHTKEGNHAGQTCITGAVVLANYYGNTDYSTESFDGEISVQDFYNLDATVDYTTSVYILNGYVVIEENANYTNIYISNVSNFDKSNKDNIYIRLYCSSASQYNWLKAYQGQLVTVEIAPTNYNNKTYYTGCVLAVVLEDGTKVINSLNFS